MVGVPLQIPVEAVSVPASSGGPPTVGASVSDGATGATTAVRALVAGVLPAAFDAVTTTRNVDPTSPDTSWYVEPVAPATFEQYAPAESQRRHWYAWLIVGVP